MRDIGDALHIEALSVKKNINYAVKNYYDTSSKAGKEYELLLLNEKINGYIEDFYVFALEKAAINDADFKDYGKISMRSLQKDITEAITKYSGKNYSLDGILNWVNRIFDKGTESFINKVQDKVQEKEIKAALYLASLKGYENYLFSTAPSGACKKCQALNGSILRISGAETGIDLPPMHPNCKCDIITGNDSFLAEESQKIVKGALVSQDKNSKAKEPLLSKKELIGFLKEMLPAEDLFFFYNPTETYISKEEIRKELKEAPEYTEELYRRYADKLIVEQMFEKEPLTDAAVQKMDFLLNYDMFKILPDIEERLAVYDILESHDEWSKVNFGPYEKKLSSKDKGWIIATYNTIRMGTSVGDIITGLTVEGLSGVTNYFVAKGSNAFNALQKMEEVDKYFKEEFLQGAQYGKEIKEFYVSNNKALEAANAIGIRDGKGTEGTGSKANPNGIKVNKGQQDKHIPGTNNYNQEVAKGKPRSILSENPQQLLDDYAGTGQLVGATKERIDFGKMIGQYYDEATGTYTDTTKGIIHYDSKGQAHIVPARP